MIFIRFTLLVLAITFSSMAIGQADQFEADVKKFIQLSNESDWTAVTDMMHPSMFSSFSKAQMATMMNQMKANGLNTNITLKAISKVHDQIKYEGQDYQKFDYDINVVVTMTEQLWSAKDFVLNGLKSNFGAENVKIDEANKTITLDGEQSMVAIKGDSSEWKYLPFQGSNDLTAKAVLPKAVFEQVE